MATHRVQVTLTAVFSISDDDLQEFGMTLEEYLAFARRDALEAPENYAESTVHVEAQVAPEGN